MSHKLPLSLLACVVAIASFGLRHAMAQQVGTAAAVNPAAQARSNGGSRTIVLGQSIAHRERVQTTSAGSVQLIFLDKTSMTVGPNSDLAIDEYVYDPASNSGRLATTLTKGVMRFVGGQISHSGNAQISTPGAIVGIRGGVGIFHVDSVYIGYGQAEVTSGLNMVSLGAGEFTQTPGRGVPPTQPGPPPEGFLQGVLALLQSGAGQGGGAPATAAQVNRARTSASGSSNGNIARNLNPSSARPVDFAIEMLHWLNLTIVAAVDDRRLQLTNASAEPIQPTATPAAGGSTESSSLSSPVAEVSSNTQAPERSSTLPTPTPPSLTQTTATTSSSPAPASGAVQEVVLLGYTGGIFRSIGRNGSLGQNYPAFGVTALEVDSEGRIGQANFALSASNTSPNTMQIGSIQFGSVDAREPPGRVIINGYEQMTGTTEALLPAVGTGGKPLSQINGQSLTKHDGLFVELKPGSELASSMASRLGTTFCRCEYTRWGLWDSQSERPGPNNATLEERGRMFWVAGKFPNVSEVPSTGSATYDGHAIANIRNRDQTYIAAGAFQNVVDFGTRTGSVSVTGLDATNYTGRMSMFRSDPRFFAATLSGSARSMALNGNFFQGSRGPVGEMGGGLQITGPSYDGGGIFAGRMR